MVPSGQSSLALKSEEKRIFIISLCLYTLVLLPILIADRFNVDDWGRSVTGYLNWGLDGRPLTDVIVRALDLGRPLVDFSPISQIASILCLSWLSAIVARKFEIKGPTIAALTTLPLGANPFFLANLSFKFDSLPMTLSLALALMPVVMDDASTGHDRRSLLVGVLLLLASLCIYQASLNAFLVIACLEYLFQQKKNETPKLIASLITRRAVQLLISIFVYKIVALYTIHEKYSIEHSSLVSGAGALLTVLQNLLSFSSFPIGMLTGRLRSTLILPIVFALLASIAVGLRYSIQTAKNGKLLLWVSGAFVTPIFMLFGTFGFLIFLQSSAPSARTFIGFGALLASSLMLISTLLTEYGVPGKLQCVLFSVSVYTMIGFAAIFGNATKAQKNYEKHIAEKLSDDLKELVAAEPARNLIIEGSVGYAPLVKQMANKRYRLLYHLVQVDLRGDETGGLCHAVLRYFGIYLPEETTETERTSIVAETTASNALRSNVYYKIFLVDHDLVVRLTPGT
jgi:Glucosyl transferase GtrII